MGGLLPERRDAHGAKRTPLACAERVVTSSQPWRKGAFGKAPCSSYPLFGGRQVSDHCSWRPLESMHGWHRDRRSITSSCRAACAPPARHANREAVETRASHPPLIGHGLRTKLLSLLQMATLGLDPSQNSSRFSARCNGCRIPPSRP